MKKSLSKLESERRYFVNSYNQCLNFYGKDNINTKHWQQQIKKIDNILKSYT